MSSPLADLLFNDYRRRVLGLLLLHPDQSYHVREIARLTSTVAGTLHKELSKLEAVGILQKTSRGNQVSYQAKRDCIVFEELASILRKTSGLADVLADALSSLAKKIDVAYVFGSVASGKATESSDIDLLVIGEVSLSELVKAFFPAQTSLGREINPKLYSVKEWQAAIKDNSSFIQELTTKPIINVIGTREPLINS